MSDIEILQSVYVQVLYISYLVMQKNLRGIVATFGSASIFSLLCNKKTMFFDLKLMNPSRLTDSEFQDYFKVIRVNFYFSG